MNFTEITTWLYLYRYPRYAKPVYKHALENRKEKLSSEYSSILHKIGTFSPINAKSLNELCSGDIINLKYTLDNLSDMKFIEKNKASYYSLTKLGTAYSC